MKDFAFLKKLREKLKKKETQNLAEEEERKRAAVQSLYDVELFRSSVGPVKSIPSDNRITPSPPHPAPVARQREADERAALRESLSDEFSVESLLETDEALSFARNGISADTLRKLRRGHWVIQSELDLHGLRTDEAREAVTDFLRDVERRGERCVRIIHGKGHGSVNREPVLKAKVRNWLAQKQEVIAFCQAKAADGGSGALVVLLRAQTG
jgi:DNA-nicking Smr family endonuclease